MDFPVKSKPPDPPPDTLWARAGRLFVALRLLPGQIRAAYLERFPGFHEKLVAFIGSLPLPQTRRERRLYLGIGLALLATVAAPFIFRPTDKPLFFGRPDVTLVILSPHNETIRREFSDAFAAWYKNRTGQRVRIDWRTPGGTSEIVKVIQSEFLAAFENHWRKNQRARWDDAFGEAFSNPQFDIDPAAKTAATAAQEARLFFLHSNIGIGVDLFFGGGVIDFQRQSRAGTLVSADASGNYGLAALRREQPDWFSDAIIPQSVGGEPYFDPEMVWAGACLSSFGIAFNENSTERLGLPPLSRWEDLTDPRLFGHVAVADPTKSGSVVKAFEMIIQEQVRLEMDRRRASIASTPPKLRPEREADAIRIGWSNGLRLIQRIGANARYFTDSATKVPQDVAQGNAAAGMCIDFYGRTFTERLKEPDGTSRVHFVTPQEGTSTGVDSIALFRGAPHPALAHAFLEFVFSVDGQKLWNYRAGAPGGPRRMSLRRLPVRRDLYTPDHLQFFADPMVLPYDTAGRFTYQPEWTAASFDAIRVAVRVMCIDTHAELQEAWQALATHGFPPQATEAFGVMGQLATATDQKNITSIMRSGDKLAQVKMFRQLGARFRDQYRHATRLARNGL